LLLRRSGFAPLNVGGGCVAGAGAGCVPFAAASFCACSFLRDASRRSDRSDTGARVRGCLGNPQACGLAVDAEHLPKANARARPHASKLQHRQHKCFTMWPCAHGAQAFFTKIDIHTLCTVLFRGQITTQAQVARACFCAAILARQTILAVALATCARPQTLRPATRASAPLCAPQRRLAAATATV